MLNGDRKIMFDNTISIEHFNQICRLCLTKDGRLINIYETYFNQIKLGKIVAQLTSLVVSQNDEFPQNICESCMTQIVGFYIFKGRCLDYHNLISAIYKSSLTSCIDIEEIKRECPFEERNDKNISPNKNSDSTKQTVNNEFGPVVKKTADNESDESQNTSEDNTSDTSDEELLNDSVEEPHNLNTEISEEALKTVAVSLQIKSEMLEADDELECEEPQTSHTEIPEKALKTVDVSLETISETLEADEELECDDSNNDFYWLYMPDEESDFLESTNGAQIVTYTCSCKRSFEEYSEFLNHNEEIAHEAVCYMCDSTLPNLNELKKHIIEHLWKRYSCPHCSVTFSTDTNLARHLKIHSGESCLVCEFCGKQFFQRPALNVHLRMHTGEKPFMCEHCGKKFSVASNLKKHLCGVQPPRVGRLQVFRDVLWRRCEECNITFDRRNSLLRHNVDVHNKKRILCRLCGKTFSKQITLYYHVRTHLNQRNHDCNICNASFFTKVSLNYHLDVHTNQKSFLCAVCSKTFRQAVHLTMHMRTHTGEKPHVCRFCNRGFTLSGNLTVHMRTHTGEKPYKCEVCSEGFYDASSRKRHRLRKHRDND